MNKESSRGTLLGIPLIQERYGPSFFASIGIHAIVVLFILFGGFLLPSTAIKMGSGPGGGMGGDVSTVGVVDELSGGAGMVKPSIVPKPPALKEKPVPADQSKAIPLPKTLEPKKKKPDSQGSKKHKTGSGFQMLFRLLPNPDQGESGDGAEAAAAVLEEETEFLSALGSGGFGDSSYARAVESRISRNWVRPAKGCASKWSTVSIFDRMERVAGIKLEKSSGNSANRFVGENVRSALHLLESSCLLRLRSSGGGRYSFLLSLSIHRIHSLGFKGML